MHRQSHSHAKFRNKATSNLRGREAKLHFLSFGKKASNFRNSLKRQPTLETALDYQSVYSSQPKLRLSSLVRFLRGIASSDDVIDQEHHHHRTQRHRHLRHNARASILNRPPRHSSRPHRQSCAIPSPLYLYSPSSPDDANV